MAIRRQTFEQKIEGPCPNGRIELFTRAMGRVMTTCTEFIVIKNIGCSLKIKNAVTGAERDYDGYMQLRINTTDFFINPDGSMSNGISNRLAPYPFKYAIESLSDIPDIYTTVEEENNDDELYRFSSMMPTYVLPGQNYELIFTLDEGNYGLGNDEYVIAGMEYELWDGYDAVVAHKLLETGISISRHMADVIRMRIITDKQGGETCPHLAFYIGFKHDLTDNIDIGNLDITGLDLHDDANQEANRDAEINKLNEFRLFCKACHEEMPFEAYEMSRLATKFKPPERPRYNVKTRGGGKS